MTRKFKVGDTVKLEGKLVEHDRAASSYPLKLELGNHDYITFTSLGERLDGSGCVLELVEAAPVEIEIGKLHPPSAPVASLRFGGRWRKRSRNMPGVSTDSGFTATFGSAAVPVTR